MSVMDTVSEPAERAREREEVSEEERDVREAVVRLVDGRDEKQRGGLLIARQPLTFLAAYFVWMKHCRVPNDSLLTRTLLHQLISSCLCVHPLYQADA